MKKTVIALLVLSSAAIADYTWIGGSSDDGTAWTTSSNWNLDGATWKGSGPMTTGSDMWGTTIINNGVTLTTPALEGWAPKVEVRNGSTLSMTLKKLQGGGYVTVDETSTLNLAITGAHKDNAFTFNIDGTLDLDFRNVNRVEGNPPGNTVFNIGDGASITIKNHTFESALTLNATLLNAAAAGESGVLTTRALLKLQNVTAGTIEGHFGEGWTNVGDGEVTGAMQYKLTTTDAGVFVSYMVIPEPATATLSLLALAGLAARRRRR